MSSKKGNKGNKKIRSHQTSETLEFMGNIGATGFEPATSRPPAVHSNQTEPHPVVQLLFFIIQNFPKKVNALSNKKSGRVILITLPDFL